MGRVGGPQLLVADHTCTPDRIAHLLMHAIGLNHERREPDPGCIEPGYEHLYQRVGATSYGGYEGADGWDTASLMRLPDALHLVCWTGEPLCFNDSVRAPCPRPTPDGTPSIWDAAAIDWMVSGGGRPEIGPSSDDQLSTARPIERGVYPGLGIYPVGDEDWYSLRVFPGETITTAIDFVHAEGDLELFLYDEAGQPLSSSRSSSNNEQLVITSATHGLVYIQVLMFGVDSYYDPTGWENDTFVPGNEYTLTVNATGSALRCEDDALEQNDEVLSASWIEGDGVRDGRVCAGDSDWFAAHLAVDETIDVTATFTTAEGDIDIRLSNSSGGQLILSNRGSDNENLTYTSIQSGMYAVEVFLYSDTGGTVPGNDYSLSITRDDPETECVGDSYEDDDSASAGTPVGSLPLVAGLTSCPSDPDWFLVDLETGDQFRVDAIFAPAEGDLGLSIRGPSSGLWSSQPEDYDSSLTMIAPIRGT